MPVMPLRQIDSFHKDPKFGRLLIISLIVHGLIWAGFAGDWFGSSKRKSPPVYYVDLIHKPVLNPQAGRPDPRPTKKQKAAPVKRSVSTSTAPKSKPKVKIPTKTVTRKPVKPVPVKPREDNRLEQARQSKIEEMRQKQEREAEREALKAKLAKLKQSVAAPTVAADVPVGMPDGTGDEAGISALIFVEAFIQQNWALSPYLLDQSRLANIEAKARLSYDAGGRMKSFRIETPSGNQQFDDSLKKAIIKSQQLPQPLPKNLDLLVTFNLKDMAAMRR